jgi:photosystem II stability/assembly factor-like uncharacterized protein
MTIGLSHGGTTTYTSAEPPSRLLVGTADGVVTLERHSVGAAWAVTASSLAGQHVRAILRERDSGLTFAGGLHTPVHVSHDDGRTWQRCDRGLQEDDVWSLAAVTLDGRCRLYAGTQPARLFSSDDLGDHWTELPGLRRVPNAARWTFPGAPHIAHLKHIDFDPRDASTMYAGIEVGGLLKSTDRGETWHEMHGFYNGVQPGTPVEDVHRIVIHPENGKRIHLVGGEGLCLWMTADGGDTWEQLTDYEHEIGGYPDCMVLNPRMPDVMFVAAAHRSPTEHRGSDSTGTRISRSRDGGRTWEVLTGGLPERLAARIEALALVDWGESFSLFAGTWAGEIYASDDEGDQWSKIIDGLAPISKGRRPALVAR